MADALERVLRLVAEGKLTAEEAGPIIDALAAAQPARTRPPTGDPAPADDAPATAVRIEVSDAGRKVINLRVPLALGKSALDAVPGLSETTSERIREAINAGIKGPILDVDDGEDGGVRVVIE